jgi:hypothetical protein
MANPGIIAAMDTMIAAGFERHARIHDKPSLGLEWPEGLCEGKICDRDFRTLCDTEMSIFDPIELGCLLPILDAAFRCPFHPSAHAHFRRVEPRGWDGHKASMVPWYDHPIGWHLDAEHGRDDVLQINCWTPMAPCGSGTKRPGLAVVIATFAEMIEFTGYRPDGIPGKTAGLAQIYKFRDISNEAVHSNFPPERRVVPQLDVGDSLIFTNFTLHGTDVGTTRDQSRQSLELRIDGSINPFLATLTSGAKKAKLPRRNFGLSAAVRLGRLFGKT